MKKTLLALALSGIATFAAAAPTTVVVHVVAHDAKLVGKHAGGARVTIRDARNGHVLAEGIQQGESGDTKILMKEPRARGASLFSTEGAAAFRATLDLEQPTRLEITAEGPLNWPGSAQRTSTTLFVVPGQTLPPDGIVLELYGLAVDLQSPKTDVTAGEVALQFKVAMMCGCPIEPGGTWDANAMKIVARLRNRHGVVAEVPAAYAGTASTFAAKFPSVASGKYTVEIVASDGAGNAGHWTSKLRVR